MKKSVLVGFGFAALAALGIGYSGCGGDSGTTTNTNADGGGDGASTDGPAGDGAKTDGGSCMKLGASCTSGGECCSAHCTSNVCNFGACTSDNQACTSNGACCSGTCANNTCTPLNTTCKTLGNTCGGSAECCSGLCSGGVCAVSSFCGQLGDVCSTGADCCGGVCDVTSDAGSGFGTCGQPPSGSANCSMVDGVLCAGVGGDGGVVLNDSGVPSCGGGCCSRLCAPYGPTGVLICQPASGCHVVGDLCTQDQDCCGSAGLPGGSGMPVTCTITAPNLVGVCRNPQGCKPDGDICRLKTMSCNASCDCCAGNCQQQDTCKQDSVGVPRCAAAQCVNPGGACASSANCCNGLPCVPNPNGTPPYVCLLAGSCVPQCGACTVTADCCVGETCVGANGSAKGTCGPCNGADAGPPPPIDAGACAQYGQQCTTTSQCCNGVPCSSGISACNGGTNCTCHFPIQ